MADYPINRGIGKPVEFKGLKSQLSFSFFAGGLLALFVLFHHHVHGGYQPVGVHHLRRYFGNAAGMAHIPAE